MHAFDQRLLQRARPVRRLLAADVILGAGASALVLVQATLLASIIAKAFEGASLREVAPKPWWDDVETLLTSGHLPAAIDPHAIMTGGVAVVEHLSPSLQAMIIGFYRQALSWSFSGGIFAAAIGFALILFIPEIELRSGTPQSPGGTAPPPERQPAAVPQAAE